jgi:hypothetical protein
MPLRARVLANSQRNTRRIPPRPKRALSRKASARSARRSPPEPVRDSDARLSLISSAGISMADPAKRKSAGAADGRNRDAR